MIMSISLQKGQKVNLSKEKKGLSRVVVGLGWDEVKRSRGFFALKPAPIDCDASAILLQNGRMAGRDDLVYYNNLTHKSGTVRHMGDNLTGEGEGDDEQIVIDLDRGTLLFLKSCCHLTDAAVPCSLSDGTEFPLTVVAIDLTKDHRRHSGVVLCQVVL